MSRRRESRLTTATRSVLVELAAEKYTRHALSCALGTRYANSLFLVAASQLGDGKGPDAFKYDYQVLFPDVFLSSKGNPTRPPFGDIFDKVISPYIQLPSPFAIFCSRTSLDKLTPRAVMVGSSRSWHTSSNVANAAAD